MTKMTSLGRIQLKPHLHRFDPNEFGSLSDLVGQEPNFGKLLIIGCSDHDVTVDDFSFTDPNRCIFVQNMAAMIPNAKTTSRFSMAATMEQAFEQEPILDLVVCHHLQCRIIPYWLTKLPGKRHEDPSGEFNDNARNLVEFHYQYASERERLMLMLCEHTLFQIENLRSHAWIKRLLMHGRLRLHGWIVDDSRAQVFAYDPRQSAFVDSRNITKKAIDRTT